MTLSHYKSLLGYVDNLKIGSADAPKQYSFGTPPEFVDADIGRKYLPRPAPEVGSRPMIGRAGWWRRGSMGVGVAGVDG